MYDKKVLSGLGWRVTHYRRNRKWHDTFTCCEALLEGALSICHICIYQKLRKQAGFILSMWTLNSSDNWKPFKKCFFRKTKTNRDLKKRKYSYQEHKTQTHDVPFHSNLLECANQTLITPGKHWLLSHFPQNIVYYDLWHGPLCPSLSLSHIFKPCGRTFQRLTFHWQLTSSCLCTRCGPPVYLTPAWPGLWGT